MIVRRDHHAHVAAWLRWRRLGSKPSPRSNHGATLCATALRLGVGRSTLANVEGGWREASLPLLERWEQAIWAEEIRATLRGLGGEG